MNTFKYFILIAAVFIVGLSIVQSCNSLPAKEKTDNVKEYFQANTDSLLAQLSLLNSAVKDKKTEAELKKQFIHCRLAFKKTEPFIEYFFQGLNKRINGPALPDIKTDDNQVWPPHGLQVIEQYLYSNYHDSVANILSNEINILKTDLLFAKKNMEEMAVLPKYFSELLQHQLIRIGILGITDLDAPLSKQSIPEAAAALQAVQEILKLKYPSQQLSFNASVQYIQQHQDFDSFNRLQFLMEYLMPLSEELYLLLEKDNESDSLPKPFSGSLSSLLKGKSFNADYFTAYSVSKTNSYKIQLGKKMFYDNQLSKSNTISCGSCHKPEMYFTDGQQKATNFVHGGSLARNTPTIYYASLQNNQFYDMRSVYLEDQVNEVMKNTEEFNFASSAIAKKIIENKDYNNLFKQAFPASDSISGIEVRNAIASFIRSLNPFTSAFDEYINGNKQAMSEEEIKGFNLFAGKAKCATCHFIPVFNGTIPPWYNRSESEIIGVPSLAVWENAKIDADEGRYRLNHLEELRFAFKTPTIRNAEKTGPYMHNAVYSTLEEVVKFYDRGGGAGIGINLPYQSLPFDSLGLKSEESKAIVAFIRTLTDKKNIY